MFEAQIRIISREFLTLVLSIRRPRYPTLQLFLLFALHLIHPVTFLSLNFPLRLFLVVLCDFPRLKPHVFVTCTLSGFVFVKPLPHPFSSFYRSKTPVCGVYTSCGVVIVKGNGTSCLFAFSSSLFVKVSSDQLPSSSEFDDVSKESSGVEALVLFDWLAWNFH